jgi:histidine ammonia-lyase
LKLEMKEGLALNNGVQYSTALGITAIGRLDRLVRTAAITTALSAQVMLGADTPFREDLHALRPHKGAQRAAKWIFALMKDSPLREAHRDVDVDGELQDPYNLRCAAQVLGTCVELVERARATFTIEANSVTDNPIVLKAAGGRHAGKHVDAVSGGHFHGMPVAVDLYGLMQAVSIVSVLTNLRCARYVDGARNKGLGADLKWPGDLGLLKEAGDTSRHDDDIRKRQAVSSTLMIPEYATASLANMIWGMAMPSHLFSLSTDAGQEDHVSMAANVGLRLHDVLPRLADALAIELCFAFQAAAIRREMRMIPSRRTTFVRLKPEQCRLSPASEAVLKEVGRHFKIVKVDRSLAGEIAALARAVLAGDIAARAEDAGMRF